MSSIDDRIVEMQFENEQFERAIRQSNDSLDDLKDHLELDGATKGLDDIQRAANEVNLGGLTGAVQQIAAAFSGLGVIAINVLSRLTQEAISFAQNAIANVINPIIEGGMNRALNLEQARFQLEGLGLDVKQIMKDALYAVEGTAFGLDSAAKAAAQFGASGVQAGDQMKTALRAVSGLAAMGGRSFDEVSNIFTKVAGQGRLMGDDINRIGVLGINAAATLAKSMGTSEEAVRKMASEGKISFATFAQAMDNAFGEHATKANETYTGSLGNLKTALARIGALYYDGVDNEFVGYLTRQRDLFNAITPLIDMAKNALIPFIKTISEIQLAGNNNLIDLLKGIAQSKAPEILLATFKNLSSVVKGLVSSFKEGFSEIFPSKGVDGVINILSAIRRFTASLIPSNKELGQLKTTFAGFFAIISIGIQFIKAIFTTIFDLINFIRGDGEGSILDFTSTIGEWLVKVDEAIKKGDIFGKIFGVIGTVIKTPIALIKGLVGFIAQMVESFAKINPDGLTEFATKLKERFEPIANLFGKIGEAAEWVGDKIGEMVAKAKNWFNDLFPKNEGKGGDNPLTNFIQGLIDGIGKITFDNVIDLINTGLVTALIFSITTLFGKIKTGIDSIAGGGGILGSISSMFDKFGGIGTSISGVFDQITGNLKAMQRQVQAKTIKDIAISLAILAGSAVVMSLVDSEKLNNSLNVLVAMMASLITSMAVMIRIIGDKKLLMLPVVTAAMITMSTALLILAGAIAIVAALPLDKAAQGVGGIVIALAALVGAVAVLNTMGPKALAGALALQMLAGVMILVAGAIAIIAAFPLDRVIQGTAAFVVTLAALVGAVSLLNLMGPKALLGAGALILLSGAMLTMATAIAIIAALPTEGAIQGAVAFAAVLAVLVGAVTLLSLIGPMVIVGALAVVALSGAMVIAAVGLVIFAQAMTTLSGMSWDDIGRGLTVLAAGLTILSIAMIAMSAGIVGSIGMVIAAAAIMVLANALKIIATMSWDDIGRTMVVLAGGLLILAGAAFAFEAAALGAVAMIAVAAAMMILAPALKLLGSMSWDEIGRGLTVLGSAIAILAVGGVLLIPAAVGFTLLGAALLLLGTGIFLASVGIGALAIGIGVLVAAGQQGIDMFIKGILAFADTIPLLALKIGEGLVIMAVTIGANAPRLIEAFVQLLIAMLSAIETVVPEIIRVATVLITSLVDALVVLIPFLVDAGLKILTGVLDGIGKNIGKVIEKGTDIVVNFINGIANAIPRIIDAAANLVLKFIIGVGDAVKKYSDDFVRAGSRLFRAIVDGVAMAIEQGGSDLNYAGRRIGNALLQGAKNALGIHSPSKAFAEVGTWSILGLINQLGKMGTKVENAGSDVGNAALTGLQKTMMDIGRTVDENVDVQPTIRPVLDLSAVKKDASQINGILTPQDQTLSLDKVKTDVYSANTGYEDNMRVMTDADGNPVTGNQTNMYYTQNNYSPKAMSTVEIYRNTKNQLSVVKGELEK